MIVGLDGTACSDARAPAAYSHPALRPGFFKIHSQVTDRVLFPGFN